MKWFKKKIAQWAREGRIEGVELAEVPQSFPRAGLPESPPVLCFKIYSAQNGKVLEFQKYDNQIDRHDNSIYVIDKETDIGEYVSKCLSLEMLK